MNLSPGASFEIDIENLNFTFPYRSRRLRRDLHIFICPLLREGPSLLLWLLDRLPGLHLASHKDISKAVLQQIPLWLKQAKRVS